MLRMRHRDKQNRAASLRIRDDAYGVLWPAVLTLMGLMATLPKGLLAVR
jgi:hypothetical protein